MANGLKRKLAIVNDALVVFLTDPAVVVMKARLNRSDGDR